jgi:cation transport ATPase
MRALRLMRVAAEAEGLRLRHRVRRTATRVACGLVAMVFMLGALVFAHVSVWYWLRQSWQPQYVALAFLGFDIAMALLLAALASRSTPDRVELEALAVRQRALEGTASSIAWSTMMVQLMRVLGNWIAR